jgi:hypothetical protein
MFYDLFIAILNAKFPGTANKMATFRKLILSQSAGTVNDPV